MRTFEINGNLSRPRGLGSKYRIFRRVVVGIRNYYIQHFGQEFMNSIDLYVDNATSDSGNTPNITPVLGKYLTIKLNITQRYDAARIAFQFAHELMHFVFYVKYGINKSHADEKEEEICSAAALIIVHKFYPADFNECNKYVKSLQRPDYRKGAEIAEQLNYQFEELIKLL